MELREYQREAVKNLRAEISKGKRQTILVAPTGSGKTVCASAIIKAAVEKKSNVLFLAHARELVLQCARKLADAGVYAGVIMAGETADAFAQVQVASKDTLLARAVRRNRIELPPADLVIVDECHRSLAEWYRHLIEQYPQAVVIGLTATPCRGDGKGLGDFYDGMVESVPISQLVKDGYLVPVRAWAPNVPDMTGVATSGGEWVKEGSAKVMDKPQLVGDAVQHWKEHANGLLTVCFATTVRHSLHLRDCFAAAGVSAEHVDAKTPLEERDAILGRLARGETLVVCNVNVLTEGWDCPAVSCMVDCQPNKKLGRFLQKAGRILRSHPGKTEALILDHAGNTLRHGWPDDDRQWTLSTTVSIEEEEEKKRKEGKRREPIRCPQCFCLYSGRLQCPNCGYEPRRQAKGIDQKDGKLIEAERSQKKSESFENKQRYWLQCLAVMAHLGRKAGAASHMYKTKFGEWPRSPLEPMPSGSEWQARVCDLYPSFTQPKGRVAA